METLPNAAARIRLPNSPTVSEPQVDGNWLYEGGGTATLLRMGTAMRDALYSDPDLVALYDRFNAGGDDLRFYADRIGEAQRRVLDLGCGTGVLAVWLASLGHEVIGVEPATAMLDLARRRKGAERVCWLHGDARTLPKSLQIEVAVMAGHAFQCLLTDADVQATLAAVRAALEPGGRCMFESRNPTARPWRAWTPEASSRTVLDARGRRVTAFHQVLSVEDELVAFQTCYRFHDRDVVSQSALRFMSMRAIDRHLRANGFAEIAYFGNWDGALFDEGSPEIIVVAA